MKTPLWMVNSLLLLLCFFSLGFILLTTIKPPSRMSIEPDLASISKPKKTISKGVVPSRIYNNDLFNTYIVMPEPAPQPILKPQIPQPPSPKPYTPPPPKEPTFLDPLSITLKGIVWQGNEQDSRTIIADQAGKQKLYRVGDKLEDAYVLHIFERKVILLRSNGQQEILYVTKSDATHDREKEIIRKQDFTKVIRAVNSSTFLVNPEEFVKVITNLGQIIDALNLSSIYQDGKPVGVRIGAFEEGSLGSALGLMENDVILAVNNIEATDVKKRLEIYNAITKLEAGAIIRVTILRNSNQTMLYYRLQTLLPEIPSAKKPTPAPAPTSASVPLPPAPDQSALREASRKMAPARTTIKKDDKQAMLKKGARQPLFKSVT